MKEIKMKEKVPNKRKWCAKCQDWYQSKKDGEYLEKYDMCIMCKRGILKI